MQDFISTTINLEEISFCLFLHYIQRNTQNQNVGSKQFQTLFWQSNLIKFAKE
jgi:hypothetical protein